MPRSSSTQPRSIARVTGPGSQWYGGGGGGGGAIVALAALTTAPSSRTAASAELGTISAELGTISAELGTICPKSSSAVVSGVSTRTTHARPRDRAHAIAADALPHMSGPHTSVGLRVAALTSSIAKR